MRLEDLSAVITQGEAKTKPYSGAADPTDLGLKSGVVQRTGHDRAMGRCQSLQYTSGDPKHAVDFVIEHFSQRAWWSLAELLQCSLSVLQVPWRSAARHSQNFQSF